MNTIYYFTYTDEHESGPILKVWKRRGIDVTQINSFLGGDAKELHDKLMTPVVIEKRKDPRELTTSSYENYKHYLRR